MAAIPFTTQKSFPEKKNSAGEQQKKIYSKKSDENKPLAHHFQVFARICRLSNRNRFFFCCFSSDATDKFSFLKYATLTYTKCTSNGRVKWNII